MLGLAVLASACGSEPTIEPRGDFSFAVFGDGPYERRDARKYERVIRQLNAAPIEWLIHIGDILWYPCSDELYLDRLASFERVAHPVVYTPGDNEWTDCHGRLEGRYDPLERLSRLREIFFSESEWSLGGRRIAVESQASDPDWPEFAENARWSHRGVTFGTFHLVGSWNGKADFEGRTATNDEEAVRRTEAAASWLRELFRQASEEDAVGVVLAFHANPLFDQPSDHAYRLTFEPFLEALEGEVEAFERPVLILHGDTHQFRVDRPMVRRSDGASMDNVTRLETYGSPDIGWVRVIVDTDGPEIFSFEPHKVPTWKLW